VTLKNKKIIAITLAIILIIALAIHHHLKIKDKLAAAKINPVLVKVQKPILQSIPVTASATGSLIARKSTIISPRAPGYIRAILFHEGETVKAGKILFKLDYQTQKDALTGAKAAYLLSKVEYDRDAKFLKKGFITQDLYYSAKATMKQNQALLQTAETNLKDRTITAPFDGTLGSLSVSLGDYVSSSNTLTTLVDNKNLRVEYALPVKDLNQLQLNQTVVVTDSAKKNKITAKVSYIAPQIDQSTQTISVHAHVNNSKELFKPGEYVTVIQNIGSAQKALLVPEQSVLASINGYHVFIVKKNKAIKTSVKIGDRIKNKVVITSGLKPTDEVIVAGENEVKDGMSVSVRIPTHTHTHTKQAHELMKP